MPKQARGREGADPRKRFCCSARFNGRCLGGKEDPIQDPWKDKEWTKISQGRKEEEEKKAGDEDLLPVGFSV